MELPIYHIDAFAQRIFAGNPAAVCLLNEWLPDNILQTIAAENYLPETSFIVSSDDQHEIRWFSPAEEMDLCGHGTLAAAHVLLRWVRPWLQEVTFQSASGELTVKRCEDEESHYLLDFPARPAAPCDMLEGLAVALGVTPRQLLKTHGAYLAVLESEKQIRQLKPDMRKLIEINCHKLIVTAPGDRVDFVSRYFIANGPIHEDPATGSAHCTLMPYWGRRLSKTKLQARQVSSRGGELGCEMRQDRILIKGAAVAYLQGTITVPSF